MCTVKEKRRERGRGRRSSRREGKSREFASSEMERATRDKAASNPATVPGAWILENALIQFQ